jgi:hypothetical protein
MTQKTIKEFENRVAQTAEMLGELHEQFTNEMAASGGKLIVENSYLELQDRLQTVTSRAQRLSLIISKAR